MNKILMISLLSLLFSSGLSRADEHKSPISTEMFLNAVAAVEKKDFVEAVRLFEVLAEEGEPASEYNLSLLHYKGLGTPENYKSALFWAWNASLDGYEKAPALVDNIRDEVTDKLITEVAESIIENLTEKAMSGDDQAAIKLGKTYYSLFIEPDIKNAYIWFVIAQALSVEGSDELLSKVKKEIETPDLLLFQTDASSTFSEITK
jgi:TPR repeat protein|tara:strand:- start:405 stop:1019 length:615 start_codon:yes stop_codon:yes gene_type:complete